MTDPMPVFTIKGKDLLAVAAIRYYHDLCATHGLHEQAAEVQKAITEIVAWQKRNPDAVKTPDHAHVPVAAAEDAERGTSAWGAC